MPTQFAGRIGLIIVLLLAALIVIFPPAKMFDGSIPLLERTSLKPGIDMVGGSSLVYQIQAPEGSFDDDLVVKVMTALKKRVDPDGIRNLVWRPQGKNRLEIQMPRSAQANEAIAKRDAFAAAQRKLDATNIKTSEVTYAIENLEGEARAASLRRLAMDSQTRAKLFEELANAWAQVQAAKAAQDPDAQATAQLKYSSLKSQIEQTNLPPEILQSALSITKAEQRNKRLDELKAASGDFPSRLAAIEEFQKPFMEFQAIKGNIDDTAELKRLLQGSGVLAFYIVERDSSKPEYAAMVDRLNTIGPVFRTGDTLRWFQVDRPGEFGSQTYSYNDKQWVLCRITPESSMVNGPGLPKWELVDVRQSADNFGRGEVAFRFDSVGARLFGNLTGAHIQQPLAISLDDRIISAPNIESRIEGSGTINGGRDGFSAEELRYLISTLSAGSLPAQLTEEPIMERTVGPQLGEDNLRRGLLACVWGLVIVAVFMIGYYYVSGMVAMVAVLMNVLFVVAVMSAIGATFTLPSVAAIVLTIGMSVDANVLIYERLREEQQRGLSIRMALRNAYDKAFSAILDSNITTGITAMVLYYFGSEEVRGFGLGLLIGLVSSLFTALFVTKTIFGMMIEYLGVERLGSVPLTFPKWNKLLLPDINWMRLSWYFGAFSGVFILIGLIAFGVRWSQKQILDIEFASGTAVQFDLKQPLPREKVAELIEAASRKDQSALPTPSVVSIGGEDLSYEVITTNIRSQQVQTAVTDAMREYLDIKARATFAGMDNDLLAAETRQVVLPVQSSDVPIAGKQIEKASDHIGGVAIVLQQLDPPLSRKDLLERLERQRLAESGERFINIDVETFDPDENTPSSTAVVFASASDVDYDGSDEQRKQQWRESLAGPVWGLTIAAVNDPPTLQRVVNFDPQVAGDFQIDAIIALLVSIVAIMAYIWLRFGNLRYGTATVVALVHDVLFAVAAIGLAHFLSDNPIGRALLLEPFRINLTIIAALLTVMGYSINDTIVVFDRVRENRGKYGALSAKIINDSVNQTLSRTLLTGTTTLATIFVMYVSGGPALHGFTFVMLVGILVGTYSSIAIAAPLLLLGVKTPGGKKSAQRSGDLQRVGN